MTGYIYRGVILEQHVRLFRGAMGAEFLFTDDNARPHRANIVEECLQSKDITRMDWPTYSPGLNPIEHVSYRTKRGKWDFGKKRREKKLARTLATESWVARPGDDLQMSAQGSWVSKKVTGCRHGGGGWQDDGLHPTANV
ncbi:transposable element Tc3 transposase [Trichonephila clavipes]|nr:transposable element Tc3 transposase [Trichonephila clavipes]